MSAQNTASDHVLLSDMHTEAQTSMPAHNLTLRCGWPVLLCKTCVAFRPLLKKQYYNSEDNDSQEHKGSLIIGREEIYIYIYIYTHTYTH